MKAIKLSISDDIHAMLIRVFGNEPAIRKQAIRLLLSEAAWMEPEWEPNRVTITVHHRWMIRADMPQVVAIEESSFAKPWSEDDFLRCLRQRNVIGMVAEHNGRVVGFTIYELHSGRLEVLNIAVTPDARRCGVGSQIVAKLIGKLSANRRRTVGMRVSEANLPAQLFFKACGFKAVGKADPFDKDHPALRFEFTVQQQSNKGLR